KFPRTSVDTPQQAHRSPACLIHKRLALLARSAEQLLRSEDPCIFLESLYGDLAAELDLEIYFHYRVDEGGELRLEAFGGVPEDTAAEIATLRMGQAVCGAAAKERRRMIIEDVQHSTDPRTALIRKLGIAAYVCHPLLARAQIVGTLSF